MFHLQNLLTCLFLFTCVNVFADANPRRIIYKGDAVKITLGVNAEQRVTFPDTKIVWADIKDKIKDKLTTQIVNNEIYWTAKDAFKQVRITIGEEGSTKVYLVDLLANHQKVSTKRILVVDGKDLYAVSSNDKKTEPESVIPALKHKKTPAAGYATLFKCAGKQVYAPDRLRKCRVGIHKEFINKRVVHNLMRYNETTTQPVAAWRSGGLHITALNVRNNTNKRITLDPRSIRGRWKARLFYKNRLQAKGHPKDNTTLFLISKEPFADAIRSNVMITTGRR